MLEASLHEKPFITTYLFFKEITSLLLLCKNTKLHVPFLDFGSLIVRARQTEFFYGIHIAILSIFTLNFTPVVIKIP